MVGAYSPNFHEGSRSEVLADYLFSAWGTVTPVRRQSDYGVDLYCTLAERQGQRAMVTDHYVIQVKSGFDPWVLKDSEEVKWLTQYPTPLFLACVDKSSGVVAVYHLAPRFMAGLFSPHSRLELVPEKFDRGEFLGWTEGETFSLSAPIVRVRIDDLCSSEIMGRLREVFSFWVRLEHENCSLYRQGLLRFRTPQSYSVNELPNSGMIEMGNFLPDYDFLKNGIRKLAEAAECIGGQLGKMEDRKGALFAAMLVDHLQGIHKEAFTNNPMWHLRVPGLLGKIVCDGLNRIHSPTGNIRYRYEGLDTLLTEFTQLPIVKRFVDEPRQ